MESRSAQVKRSLERGLVLRAGEPLIASTTRRHSCSLQRDDWTVALDPEGPAWLSTNAMGRGALRLADGRRTVRGVAAALAARPGVGEDTPHTRLFYAEVTTLDLSAFGPSYGRPIAGAPRRWRQGRSPSCTSS